MLLSLMTSINDLNDKMYIGKFIVVDNNSSDDSLSLVTNSEWDFNVEVLKNNTNSGFARACNFGASVGSSEYILFLNPDTIVYEDALSAPLKFMASPENHEYAACGIQLVDEKNIPNRCCARIPDFSNFINSGLGLDMLAPNQFKGILHREWTHQESRDVGHVIGAFYFVRRKIFEQFKGFDPRYFLYYEDLDLSTNITKAGYKVAYLSQPKAIHIGGGCSEKIKAKRLSYSYLSKVLYILKHFPFTKALPLVALVFIVEPIQRFSFYIIRLSFKEALLSLTGYLLFLWSILSLPFSQRNYVQH